MKEKKRTILIIRTSALGDVAMSIPVIYALARQYPDMQVKVLTQKFFCRLFVNHPSNISFVIADWKGKHRGIAGLLRLVLELKKYHINYVADFHNVLRSLFIDFYFILTGTPVCIVDKGRRERKTLTRTQHKSTAPQKNYIFRYADLLRQLNLPVELNFTSLFDEGKPQDACLPLPVPPSDTVSIGIAPFARYTTKTYPPQLMEQVIAKLTAKGYHLYLFGGGGHEQELLQQWEQKYSLCTALPGLLTIEQELALMAQLNVMLTMDSANMHLASLAGTPAVSIWGSTTPACGFLGWRQKESNAVCLQLPCQPCSISGKEKCPLQHFFCMTSVTPDSIYQRIEKNISVLTPRQS